jgi:hypothetical protein
MGCTQPTSCNRFAERFCAVRCGYSCDCDGIVFLYRNQKPGDRDLLDQQCSARNLRSAPIHCFRDDLLCLGGEGILDELHAYSSGFNSFLKHFLTSLLEFLKILLPLSKMF